jgi:outer membrane receptor protein involved in Fe transport
MSKARSMVSGLLAAIASGSLVAQEAKTVQLDISSQPLNRALNAWADQTGYQVMISEERAARGRLAPALKGTYTPEGALRVLLASSDLEYRFVSEHTVAITRTTTTTEENAPLAPAPSRPRETEEVATPQSAGQAEGKANEREGIEQVIVSAQKRNERLQDVPVPVTAMDAAVLTQNNQTRLMDYYTRVPGLIVSPADYSSQLVAIRGVTTGSNSGAGTPTTGIMVDDVPFGNSTGNTPGFTVPDFDPGDLARVEVLRGPQGTLYGASSMGGLIKYVTVDPSAAAFGARLELGSNSIRNGDEIGYMARGSINVPLGETLAVRGSAFTRLDPGYIDNPVTGADGVNRARAIGGRVVGLWKPMESFSLRLSANFQRIRGDGTGDTTTQENLSGEFRSLGDLQQGYIRGVGPYTREAEAYGAVATFRFAGAELTAVTGYNVSDVEDSIDYTSQLHDVARDIFGVGGAPIYEKVVNSRFSEELRLAVPLGERFDSLVGVYYDDEEAGPQRQRLLAADPLTAVPAGVLLDVSFPSAYRERAAFADITWHITDQFDVQVGGRYSWLDVRLKESVSSGAFVGDAPAVRAQLVAKNQQSTYLFTPRWKLSETQMLYARFASGYRPGGPNIVTGVPPIYDPDTTENYELGYKADFLNGAIAIDTSIYHIDWKRIQLNLVDPATLFGFTGNAGKARSQGAELSVDWRLDGGLTIGTWVAFNDAKLVNWPAEAQTACELGMGPCARSGERLPLSPRFSGNLSVDQRFRLTDRSRAALGLDLSYVGGRKGVFPFAPPRQEMPAYAKTDLRAGFDYDAWRANLYVNNLFDRRGLVSGGLGTDLPYSFYYIQPRTVGISLSREF